MDAPQPPPTAPRDLPVWVWVAAGAGLLLLPLAWFLLGRDQPAPRRGPFLVCPVAAGVVDDNFGAPRIGHGHLGVDIAAERGAPVLAVFPGEIFNSKTPGGKVVFLESHNGALVVGKHLSEVTPERSVRTGDVIGYVGSVRPNSPPHLHFEWRPDGATLVDPFPLLAQVCPDTTSG